MIRPVATPLATAILYRDADGTILIVVEAAGLQHFSPAAPSTGGWPDAESALKHAAEVLTEHLARKIPATAKLPALPDVDLNGLERP